MGFTYEVATLGVLEGKPIANIYHVWDGDESETPDDVADVYETHLLPDAAAYQSDRLLWSRISVTPLDVGNLQNAISRVVNIPGTNASELAMTGAHIWIKFVSDDNGFKSGGKLFPGVFEGATLDGVVTTAVLSAIQTVFDDYLTDLVTAGLTAAIYRPTLSTPGFPSVSVVSACVARGLGTNNRRQLPFQK